jgi:hypothetical protein
MKMELIYEIVKVDMIFIIVIKILWIIMGMGLMLLEPFEQSEIIVFELYE